MAENRFLVTFRPDKRGIKRQDAVTTQNGLLQIRSQLGDLIEKVESIDGAPVPELPKVQPKLNPYEEQQNAGLAVMAKSIDAMDLKLVNIELKIDSLKNVATSAEPVIIESFNADLMKDEELIDIVLKRGRSASWIYKYAKSLAAAPTTVEKI